MLGKPVIQPSMLEETVAVADRLVPVVFGLLGLEPLRKIEIIVWPDQVFEGSFGSTKLGSPVIGVGSFHPRPVISLSQACYASEWALVQMMAHEMVHISLWLVADERLPSVVDEAIAQSIAMNYNWIKWPTGAIERTSTKGIDFSTLALRGKDAAAMTEEERHVVYQSGHAILDKLVLEEILRMMRAGHASPSVFEEALRNAR